MVDSNIMQTAGMAYLMWVFPKYGRWPSNKTRRLCSLDTLDGQLTLRDVDEANRRIDRYTNFA